MRILQWNLCFMVVVVFMTAVAGERILFLNPIGSKSHKIFYMAITEALANRGHHVTVVSSFKPFKEIPNVREVLIKDMNLDEILNSAFDRPESAFMNLIRNTPTMCSDTLAQKQVQDLKKEKFDLLILSPFMNFCYFSLVDHFKVPFIYGVSAGLVRPLSYFMNNVEFPSFVPNKMLESDYPPTFIDRFKSTFADSMFMLATQYTISRSQTVCIERGLCREDMPSFTDIHNNFSLVIVNSVRTLDKPPRPTMSNVIYGGGAHIKPAKKLPEDLEKWASESGQDGFIFFSLGSAMNPVYLPENYRNIIMKVFASLKQRVIMKWHEDTMENLPPNVKLGKWLPQQDILGHPNIKIFITHGGYSSTQESIYHNVPILGMPIFADQFSNLMDAKKEGWANIVKWDELEENRLRNAIMDTINNKSMKEVLTFHSTIMRDVLNSPDQEIVFWVEYVLRHNGALHLRSPIANMSWFKLYNMDVWATISVLIFGVMYGFFCIIKWIYCLIFSKKTSGTKAKKKRE